MEPHVHGEKEALQQFFGGRDVSHVLDSSVAVDTSILERYLSSDLDPNTFALPDSPPDSEACSPEQIPDLQMEPSYWSNQPMVARQLANCAFFADHAYIPPDRLLSHDPASSVVRCASSAVPPTQRSGGHLLHSDRCCLPSPSTHGVPWTASAPPASTSLPGSASIPHTSSPVSKRRRSGSQDSSAEPETSHRDAACGGQGLSGLLTWEKFRPGEWNTAMDVSFQTLCPPVFLVDTDKGFNYSPADDAFVCQKKNHFQVTVHVGVATEPRYMPTSHGVQQVDHFLVKVFGIKLEAPEHHVTIEQSQADRSKKPLLPVRVALNGGGISKVTLGRLHFSETTANNMRKKGRPNPDQRYFQMVVGLYAAIREEEEEKSFLMAALMSERLIIRASNPGQFEMESDTLWQRGAVQDAVICHGRVGINTDAPKEALVVCGNAIVTGSLMRPSDQRAKENIQEVDPEKQLKNITQMRLVEFDFKPQFASSIGIDHAHQTGLLAQELKELLPSAVKEVGDITSGDGQKIENFLVVDKEQIFMENVGAVQQLSKMADNLESRVTELEVWKRRLAKLKSLTGSLRSTSTASRKQSIVSASHAFHVPTKSSTTGDGGHCVPHRTFQACIFTLCITVAVCSMTIGALYLLSLSQQSDMSAGTSNSSVIPGTTTAGSSSAPPTSPSWPTMPWPPDVHFCDLLYCDTVYCCPSPPGGRRNANVTSSQSGEGEGAGKNKEDFFQKFLSARDWTNTSMESFMIKENQQVIDRRYCVRDECGPDRFVFQVPISPFVPVNMRVTLLMNSKQLLVVHLCAFQESSTCASVHDRTHVSAGRYPSNTQGEHEWPLHVARLHHSSYHFRSAVAGQADCSTNHHFAEALFTDYHFYFYRRCTD
ncbi:myelin regulatory factor-like protein isoform X2 [Entelurus aequoreus]|uniref:myelin regulatory factor-like protein isoform X2 n=1 Tax=Entelurus aequoreus TaxID=161455 RepID=UPI002B1D16AC|nr:myelin regulatory factor-like protein isoform X2 [Entelurus aequoreus]